MEAGRFGKATVGVLTVIQEELEAAKAALGAMTRYDQSRYWYRDDPHQFVLAKMPDRGNVAASEATRHIFEYWRPDVIVLVGIAGGLSAEDAGLGDVVIPDYIHYGDFRKISAGRDVLRFAAYDQPTVTLRQDTLESLAEEGHWRDAISEYRPERQEGDPEPGEDATPRFAVGGLVAGEKILGDPDHPEQERVFVTFEHALALDMESFGVARAVHDERRYADYNPRLSIIRGISDIVVRSDIAAPPRGGDDHIENTGVQPLGRLSEAEINHAQRRRWKKYAAASAAALAALVVDELISHV
jgi:nucleoside phosphorylase